MPAPRRGSGSRGSRRWRSGWGRGGPGRSHAVRKGVCRQAGPAQAGCVVIRAGAHRVAAPRRSTGGKRSSPLAGGGGEAEDGSELGVDCCPSELGFCWGEALRNHAFGSKVGGAGDEVCVLPRSQGGEEEAVVLLMQILALERQRFCAPRLRSSGEPCVHLRGADVQLRDSRAG